MKAVCLAHVEVNSAHNVRIKSTLKPINQIMKKKMPREGRGLIATSCLLSGYDHVSHTEHFREMNAYSTREWLECNIASIFWS